jgi:raffinose/stachyose/melibiose transport system substrate-binding protein
MKMMLRFMAFVLCSALIVGTVGAQGSKKLTFAINWLPNDQISKTYQDMAAAYTAQNPGVQIEVAALGSQYEPIMKTKMAANDLPDLFTTHGWSVIRYSEYLTPLNDQAWFAKINPAIKPVITNESGKVFVLPMDTEVAGVVFNKDVLDKAKVNPYKIRTWDDFKAACAAVKKIGKVPVHIGGNPKDDWTIGNFYDWTAPSFLITNDKDNSRKALSDGSFDWKKWGPVAKLLTDFRDEGYLNPDYTQGTWEDVGKKLASGDVAFGFFGSYLIGEAKKYNPSGHYGFMPVPAASAADTPTVITGERAAIGVWKDSPNKAEALKFLAFLAQPENVNKVATVNANPTGLVGAGFKSALGDLAPYYDKLVGVRGFPYFDRAYLPSGMWDSMCKTGTGLLAKTMTLDQAVDKMKGDYQGLRGQ